jgi:DNA (cytosine-5)-methyltransferase 1
MVLSTFACGGGSSFGYKMAGFDVIGFNEIDKEMVGFYLANHHPKFTYHEPIQTFKNRTDLPEELFNLDILDGSPPCFAAGTPVLTCRGIIPIEMVKIGDLVCTHMRRWRKVTSTMSRMSPTVLVDNRIETTPDHRFYSRRANRKSEARNLGHAEWVVSKDLSGCFLATPMVIEELPLDVAPEGFEYSNDFWYLVGRWLGDGWVRYEEAGSEPKRTQERYVPEQRPCVNCEVNPARPHERYEGWWTSYCSEKCRRQYKDRFHNRGRADVVICCAYEESDDLQAKMEKAGCHIGTSNEETVVRKFIHSKALVLWLMEHFGRGAKGKTIPGWVLSMPKEWRESLLLGYLESDGHECEEGFFMASTVGRCLLSGMNLLANTLGRTTSVVKRLPTTDIILGRKCNVSESWALSIHEDDGRYTDVQDGMRWKKLRRPVVPASELVEVFDIEVDEDHSFVADGYVVHNCSLFSMAGDREENWGKSKKFREGQADQILSDLFFDYLDLVGKLRPKVSVAENVKGMLIGKAKGYCDLIFKRYDSLGYDVQLFLINAATLGVPQRRERVFFVARRRDLNLPKLVLNINEKPVTFMDLSSKLPFQDLTDTDGNDLMRAFWNKTIPGKGFEDAAGGNYFNHKRLALDEPTLTLTAGCCLTHPTEMRNISWIEACLIGSYPYDYDFLGKDWKMKVYCIGMSVPPVMTAQLAAQIAEQWFGVKAEQIDEAWK